MTSETRELDRLVAEKVDRLRNAIDDIRHSLYELEDEVERLDRVSGPANPDCFSCQHPRRWHMTDRPICMADGCRCVVLGGEME